MLPAATFSYQEIAVGRPFGINNSGLVVGDLGANNNAAVVWTEANGGQIIGPLDGNFANPSGFFGVNNAGEAVGISGFMGNIVLTKWTQSTGNYVQVPTGHGRNFFPHISDSGDIAFTDDASGGQPHFIPSGGSVVALQHPPPYVSGFETGINNNGVIVGYLNITIAPERPVAWPRYDQPPVTLPSLGGDHAQANHINTAGDIVGWSEITPGSNVHHAVLWPASGGMVDLTTWPNPCAGTSEANAVNNLGIIVGSCDARPVLWTAVEGMRFLPVPVGKSAIDAHVINDNNEIAGHSGIISGGHGAFWKIANQAPVANPGGPYTGVEGTPVNFSGAGSSDPDGDPLTYSWDFGDGSIGSGSIVSHTYTDNGSFTIKLIVTDSHGASSSPVTTAATIDNVAPTATFTNTAPVAEGTAFVLQLNGVGDASSVDQAAGFSYAFDCGSGYGSFGSSPSTSCPTTDNAVRTVRAIVRDKDTGTREYAGSATVTNVAPSVGPLNTPATPLALVGGGTSVSLSGSFTDPGIGDTHTGSLDCDGGTAGSVSASASGGSGTASGICTLSASGVYVVSLTVTDDDGASDTEPASQFIVVYDPSGGFVTGGGWITSPAGAYAPNTAFAGKATFGFVAKYQKGANVPSGNTEFQFQAGAFSFSSTSYQWLVVAGAKAQYRGDGTVNGQSGYGFLLTATDGDRLGGGVVDKFRIKVWEKTTGAIVYDNVRSAGDDIDAANPQALGGGSITIHP